ncbi:MAG: efflux RND transporter permease subunit [bacterium]
MIKFFVEKPLFTLSLFIIILLIGCFSLVNLPLDFLPNIEIPTLTILTVYPGANPEDIETTVSKVIEDGVATVPNIDKITSNSIENLSTVTLQFKWGASLDTASADTRDKMDAIRGNLPSDVQPSTILKFSTSQIPVLQLGISADESYNDLYHLADKTISKDLKRIKGVGAVNIVGGLERQINVDIDRHRMEAYGLSLNQVNGALASSNLSMPAGNLYTGELQYGLRVPEEFTSVDQIGRTIIGNYNNREIFLSDIATVADDFKEIENMIEVDGKPGIMLTIQKQSGANTVNVVADAKAALAATQDKLPKDVKITILQDSAENIVMQIDELIRTLGYSFFFVFLTVLFFLRNVRGSIIVSMAIPFSLIAAFVYLYVAGSSINIISLASIIIAIGVVVDDAIVILENVFRHTEKKHERVKEAAVYGAGEVSGAVIAATTTNVAIFIPMLIIGGFVGIFFQQLAAITIVVISMSMIVAISLTPMLCSKLLKVGSEGKKGNRFIKMLVDRSEKWFENIEDGYKGLLGWAISRRKMIMVLCGFFFVISMPLFSLIGSEFFPDQDSGYISADVSMPPGTSWKETAKAMKKIEARAKTEMPEIEYIMVSAGSTGKFSFSDKNGSNYGSIYIKVVPLSQRKRTLEELERVASKIALAIPGIKAIDYQQSGANQIMGSDKPVTVEIYGDDFDVLDQLAADIKTKIEKVSGAVYPAISREKSNPEYAININREKAADLGFSVADVAMMARGNFYGTQVTKYREGGDQYDIFSRLREENRKTIEDIKSSVITSRTGNSVALGNIADVQLRWGPQKIQRKNQQRLVKVGADVYGRSLGDVISDVTKIIAKIPKPADVDIKMGGSAEQMQESFRSLFIALMLGLSLLYLVMVAQFESFVDPFVIMAAIPFALVGVVWALFLTSTPFGIMPFIGLIMAAGVAVKTSIVLVDYTNILRERGVPLQEAVMEAGRTRLRPILMTTCTAMLGLMPIVLGGGEGAGFWKPMGIAVLGGLFVSANITLLFVPTFYYIIESRAERKHKK